MTVPVPPSLCSALAGRDEVGGEGGSGWEGWSQLLEAEHLSFRSLGSGVSHPAALGTEAVEMVPSASPDTPANWRENKGFPVLHASFSKQNE